MGQLVLLKISPTRGNIRIGRRKKLNPRYIGPFRVTEKINPVAYRIDLPLSLTRIHDVFHISQLKPFIGDIAESTFVPAEIPHEEIREDLTFESRPVQIVDRQIRKLRNKDISQVRVQWDDQSGKQDSWESEEEMLAQYPYLFGVTDV